MTIHLEHKNWEPDHPSLADPRLDWAPTHDERSGNYPIRAKMGEVDVHPKTWDRGLILDQGNEGACVGFGWTAELMASPRPDPDVNTSQANQYARDLYHFAQKIDEWPGENYDGTSVLAGAQALQRRGLISEYRWAFSIEDVRDAVITQGPVVIGIPWYEDMYRTRKSGLVEVGGPLVGGHCLTLFAYNPSQHIFGEDWDNLYNVFRWQNSWSESYGMRGTGYIRYEDLRDLLKDWGEACVPMGRNLVRIEDKG